MLIIIVELQEQFNTFQPNIQKFRNMRKKTLALLDQNRHYTKGKTEYRSPQSWQTSANTPQLYLPHIHLATPATPISHNTTAVEQLEHYVRSLIRNRREEVTFLKRQKQLKEKQQAIKENSEQTSEAYKKKIYNRHIHQLHQKLRELKGELEVQQTKLQVEGSIQQKMMVQYKQVYDSLHNRIRGCNRKDETAQTQTLQASCGPLFHPQSQQGKPTPGLFKRKFRIIGYVVYFSLVFPKYAKVFREIRRQYFYQKIVYPQRLGQVIQDYTNYLSSLKLAGLQRQSQRKSRKSNEFAPSFSFEEVDEEGSVKVKSIPLQSIQEVVVYLLQKIKEGIKGGILDELLNCMSFYFINRSFLSDHVFLPEQLYRLKINTTTLQMLLPKQQEVQLLTNFLIGKLTCFHFMIASKVERKLFRRNSRLIKQRQNQSLARSLLLGGLYLFNKCNQFTSNPQVDDALRLEANIQDLKKEELPVPMGALEIPDRFDLGEDEGPKEKRTSIQMKIDEGDLNNEGIRYKNMVNTQDILNSFSQKSESSSKILEQLEQIGQLMYQKCRQSRAEHFMDIGRSAVTHRYYLTKQVEFTAFTQQRLPNQAVLVQSYRSLILRARQQTKNNKNYFSNSQSKKTTQVDLQKVIQAHQYKLIGLRLYMRVQLSLFSLKHIYLIR